jgi:cellulose synthase/poly-beta-1,6-N-acetylglucosamine synthase-like glycosyltransferase
MHRGVAFQLVPVPQIIGIKERHAAVHQLAPGLAISFARVAFSSSPAPDDWAAQTCSAMLAGPVGVAQLLAENPACTMSNVVIRRDALARVGPFHSGMSFAEDQEWLVRAAAAGLSIRAIDHILVAYRLSPDGLSVNLERMHAGWHALAAAHGGGDAIRLRAAEARYCRYLARRALRAGATPGTALRYARLGLALSAAAFLADGRRGWATIAGVLAAPFLPRWARLRLFA